MATTLLADGRAEDVADMVEPLLDSVTAPAANTGQILLRGLMARVEVMHRDHLDPALELLPPVEEVADSCTCVRAEVALWRGWVNARRSETIDEASWALHLLKGSQELFASICDPVGRCWALLGRARAYYALEEYGLMRRVLDDAAELLDRLQDTQARRWLHELRIPALRIAGQYERAEEHVQALRSIAEDWTGRRVRGHAAAHTALLRHDRGAAPSSILDAAEAATSLLRPEDRAATDLFLRVLRARAGALGRQKDRPEAFDVLDDAEAFLPDNSSVNTPLQVLRARVALCRGDHSRALAVLDDSFEHALPRQPDLQRSSIALLYGKIFFEQDHVDDAESWLRRARRVAQETGHHVNHQRARKALAGDSEDRSVPALSSGPPSNGRAPPPDRSSSSQQAQVALSRSTVDPTAVVDGFVAESREMQAVADTIRQIQPSHSPALVTGESGAGKRLVARAVHATSERVDGPMEVISCDPTQTEEPLEARLFGIVEGDGTRRPGAVHAADGGTLVIEDVEALPRPLQSSLLHLLDAGEVTPAGSTAPEPVDVRIVATTTADLDARVQENRFRRALRDRLRVISLHVPPLRERRADISLLVRHFLDALSPADSALVSITQPAMEALLRYNWPGNVRQLRNEIERALVHVQSEPAPTIDTDILLDTIVEEAKYSESSRTTEENLDAILQPDQTLNDVLSRTEKSVIERVLRACDGQVTASADVLGLTRQGLYKKMKRLDIDASAFQSSPEPAPASS
ncbi:sigma 54-interacting transcriptional regulator [Salinibacter sp.]|uniref:sigma 54-interacting transcriptional regulator n=1 Tax=Salinibacter sp. TaxID=2065818 RepID=UPI0035D482F7